MSYEHGEHVPGRGWYDRGLKGFVNSPGKVTPVLHDTSGSRRSSLGAVKFRDDVRRTDDIVRESNASTFRPSPRLERLRKFRDSDRPEERAVYQRSSPTTKMSLGAYETGLRDYLAAGNDLPDDVAKPKEA